MTTRHSDLMGQMRVPDGRFSFDFDEHFGSLMRACEAEFRFRGGTAEEIRRWQAAFRDRLRTHLGLANLEEDLAGFVPKAQLFGCDWDRTRGSRGASSPS